MCEHLLRPCALKQLVRKQQIPHQSTVKIVGNEQREENQGMGGNRGGFFQEAGASEASAGVPRKEKERRMPGFC